ncbi:MAG TPA: hypothetical protein VIG80_13130 [Bacillaceae bacterium]
MKKLFGVVIIVFSLFLALGALLGFEENPAASIFGIAVLSFPIYLAGHLVRTSKAEFKFKARRWAGIYVCVVALIPFIFYQFLSYEERKWNAISDGQYILYEPGSNGWGAFSIILMMVLILLTIGNFFNPKLKRRKLLASITISVAMIYGGFQYMMWKDYRGVHEELGLISQSWSGKRTVMSFDDLAGIYIVPSVHRASLNNPSDETEFIWNLIFIDQDGERTSYLFRGLSQERLDSALQIKDIAHLKNIPFQVGEMDNKTRKWFELEFELNELEKEPFYRFFEVEDRS